MSSVDSWSDQVREVSIADVVVGVRRAARSVIEHRRLLLAPMALALLFGSSYAFGTSREYTATAKLLSYAGRPGGASISGMAGLAGIRLPTGGSGEAVVSSDLYPDIAASFNFRLSLASTPMKFGGHDSLLSPAQYFSSLYTPGVLGRLRSFTANPRVNPRRSFSSVDTSAMNPLSSENGPPLDDVAAERVAAFMNNRVSVSVDSRGMVSVSAMMPDAVAATSLARASTKLLTETVLSYEVRKADEQLAFIQKQYDQVRARYDTAQRSLARFVDRNRILISATAQIERDRLQREADIAFELSQQLGREREQARIKRNQDVPILAVMEPARVPSVQSSPNRARILLVSGFVGLVLGFFRIFLHAVTVRTNAAEDTPAAPARMS